MTVPYVVVEINPNLRLSDDRTVVELTPELAELSRSAEVAVYERYSGVFGRAWIDEFDREDNSVILKVDWANLRIPAAMRLNAAPTVTMTMGTPTGHPLNLAMPSPAGVAA